MIGVKLADAFEVSLFQLRMKGNPWGAMMGQHRETEGKMRFRRSTWPGIISKEDFLNPEVENLRKLECQRQTGVIFPLFDGMNRLTRYFHQIS
jgi:hypothetical protein